MPLLGFGTWKSPHDVASAAVAAALAAGYRHVDAAAVYCNEKAVGEGLRNGMSANGLSRDDVFITSKLWNSDHAVDRVEPALRETLSDLGVEYLDLYLIHFPVVFDYIPPSDSSRFSAFFPTNADGSVAFGSTPLAETWKEMARLQKAGLVKAIGVSNFSAALIEELVRATGVTPAVNQIELHPLLSQKKLVAYCQKRNIAVTAYSSLGDLSYRSFKHFTYKGKKLIEEDVVVATAKAVGKTPAQVLLRWAVQQNIIVIPKSSTEERIKENADVFSFSLTDDQMAALDALNVDQRFNIDTEVFWDQPIWS